MNLRTPKMAKVELRGHGKSGPAIARRRYWLGQTSSALSGHEDSASTIQGRRSHRLAGLGLVSNALWGRKQEVAQHVRSRLTPERSSPVTITVRHVRAAMASSAEILLCGDDPEQLDSVAESAFAELARIEQLLSRFDPTSELSRINREAACGECLVDFEVLRILLDCQAWWLRTERAFDITAGSRDESGAPRTYDAVRLDASQRRISFQSPGVRLDLGAYGKGYGLDRMARLICQQGITSALLHLGTSSVVAIGSPPDADGWRIGLRDPDDAMCESQQLTLSNAALSTSATRHSSRETTAISDLFDPRSGQPLATPASCTVIAPTASAAEALSTAFVVLGRDRTDKLLAEWNDASLRAMWTGCSRDTSRGGK